MSLRNVVLLLFAFLYNQFDAQTGVIKGKVLDLQSEMALIGCNVILQGSDPIIGATTDLDGYFRMEAVPVGRQSLSITYLGYEPQMIPNVVVTSGKEIDLEIKLQESLEVMEAVVVSSAADKDRANNEMATMSARQFSLEEVRRYSGGRGDVARLASNFAGVSSPDDSRNDIVVRGNSPTGVLWRIDGIPVPNPNQFATFGTTGGPVSALNPNMMKNSDFITSAFPAEYGNALGGVFDIGFRYGNRDKAEYSFQMGTFSGLEATAEGPLRKGKGSYLVAGRYSLVGLVSGAAGTTATPIYSDLTTKIDFGNTSLGRLEFFALVGPSKIEFIGAELDSTDLFANRDEDGRYNGFIATAGLTHTALVGDKAYLKTTIGGSFADNTFEQDRYFNVGTDEEIRLRYFEVDNSEQRLTLNSRYNSKINSRATLRVGILVESITLNSFLKDRQDNPDEDGDGWPDIRFIYDIDGTYLMAQPYAQTVYRLSDNWKLNAGLHAQYLDLNEELALEPRLSMEYTLTERSSLKLGYGLHHQNAPGPILFSSNYEDGRYFQRNEDLDMIRSQHFVLGYDQRLGVDWRLKAEVYYQAIDKAGVDRFSSSYSTLTEGAGFGFNTGKTDLVSEGSGENMGLELTIEKFFSKRYYVLLTSSFFEATYKGSDGVERNSPFNNGYVLNLLAGREFPLDEKERRLVFMDTKFTTAGGRYYTPIDLKASQITGSQVEIDEKAFSLQNDPYIRWDVKLGARFNSQKKKIAHQFYFELQNVLDTDNIFARRYNRQTNEINTVYQQGIFPDFGYRLQF